ncbi:MAG: DNA polymerase IV [Bacteroidales bacterium]
MREEKRVIAHMDLDSFYVSVERLLNSKLKEVPVIIGGLSSRSVVASCSYEARKYGVHAAMPMHKARYLCPEARIIRGDMDLYSKYSRMVTEIISGSAPVFEKASIDEHYLDISGMDRFFGCEKWTNELCAKISRETGLPISSGLSVNKTVSKMATTESKPKGHLYIPYNRVQFFLDPLHIQKIPMVGKKTSHLLMQMGVDSILTLRKVPSEMLCRLLGKNGLLIWKRANGIDHTPVHIYSECKSISTEHTFDQDTADLNFLKTVLSNMVEKLCFKIRRREMLTGSVSVKIRYSDFDTHSLQKKIPYTSFDHLISEIVESLFLRLFQRRVLVRLIGIRFSHLVRGSQQLTFFDDDKRTSLYQALDSIRARYGNQSVQKVSAIYRK